MRINKYLTSYKMGVQKSLEYRFDFFIGLISAVFPIIIQTYLWSAIYKNSSDGVHYGYTFAQILMYTFIAGIVAQFVETGVELRINEDIHTGQLGNYLVRPVSYAPFRLLSVMGEKLFASLIMAVVIAIIVFAFPFFTTIQFQVSSVLCFIITLLLGFILSFLLFYCIGMIGLWFIEISKLFGAIRVALLVFTGGVFPLEVFGETIFSVMKFFPFMYITYFPTNVLNGNIAGQEILGGISLQLFWIIAFALLSQLLWRKGLKQYAPVGG